MSPGTGPGLLISAALVAGELVTHIYKEQPERNDQDRPSCIGNRSDLRPAED